MTVQKFMYLQSDLKSAEYREETDKWLARELQDRLQSEVHVI